MQDLQAISEDFVRVFERIQQERMRNIPLLNPMLRVEALGFQEYQGRVVGIVVTPWFMGLVMLPGEDDHWDDLKLGDKRPYEFPFSTYAFMLNEIEGIGRYMSHSLYSPMNEFDNQGHAQAAAQSFLDLLMVQPQQKADVIDEDLLGKIMRGEETPEVDLDQFAEIDQLGGRGADIPETCPARSQVKKEISRRDLLRGDFLEDT